MSNKEERVQMERAIIKEALAAQSLEYEETAAHAEAMAVAEREGSERAKAEEERLRYEVKKNENRREAERRRAEKAHKKKEGWSWASIGLSFLMTDATTIQHEKEPVAPSGVATIARYSWSHSGLRSLPKYVRQAST